MLKLKEIFEHQHSLAHKYNPIERQMGFPAPSELPMELNSYEGQDRLRMFYAYICEEITEALTAPTEEYAEELSDVLHFATEFCLIAGIKPEEIEDRYHVHRQLELFEPVPNNPSLHQVQLLWGRAVNLLKYKRWKQSPKNTDRYHFNYRIADAFVALIHHIESQKLSPHEIYMAKHKKNEERIQTGY